MLEAKKKDRAFGSRYDDTERSKRRISSGQHRMLVGSKWDKFGQLQLDFLKNYGLKPDQKLLDIGCGCLRAGVKIVPYLNINNYYGIDRDNGLLDVGYDVELKKAGIQNRLIRDNLFCSSLFEHGRLPHNTIDVGICNSVMTPLPQNFIRICLENTEAYFKVGARLFITFFELPPQYPFAKKCKNQYGIVTSGYTDNYHYYATDMLNAAARTKWIARYIGDWGHPRGQNMVEYTRV